MTASRDARGDLHHLTEGGTEPRKVRVPQLSLFQSLDPVQCPLAFSSVYLVGEVPLRQWLIAEVYCAFLFIPSLFFRAVKVTYRKYSIERYTMGKSGGWGDRPRKLYPRSQMLVRQKEKDINEEQTKDTKIATPYVNQAMSFLAAQVKGSMRSVTGKGQAKSSQPLSLKNKLLGGGAF